MTDETEPWFRDGLAFECTRCGACCTGAPGYVWVDDEEIQALAGLLNLSLDAFARKYLRRVGGRISLIERPGGDCIFWSKSDGCTVYQARPVQCRTWPFWPENLESREDWDQATRTCPGSHRESVRVFTVEEILDAAGRCHT